MNPEKRSWFLQGVPVKIHSFLEHFLEIICRRIVFSLIWRWYRSSHPEVFLVKAVLQMCSKSQSNFIEITLRHRCSSVNLPDILITPFSKNTSGWLLWLIRNLILTFRIESSVTRKFTIPFLVTKIVAQKLCKNRKNCESSKYNSCLPDVSKFWQNHRICKTLTQK